MALDADRTGHNGRDPIRQTIKRPCRSSPMPGRGEVDLAAESDRRMGELLPWNRKGKTGTLPT